MTVKLKVKQFKLKTLFFHRKRKATCSETEIQNLLKRKFGLMKLEVH